VSTAGHASLYPIGHLSMPLRLGNFQPQRGSWSTTFAEPTRIVDSSFFQGADEDAETFGQQGGLIIDTRDLFRLRKTVAAGTIRGAVRAMLTSSNGRFEPPQDKRTALTPIRPQVAPVSLGGDPHGRRPIERPAVRVERRTVHSVIACAALLRPPPRPKQAS